MRRTILLPGLICLLCACQHATVKMPDRQYQPIGMVAAFGQSDWQTVLSRVVAPGGYVRWPVFDDPKSAARDSLNRYVALLAVASPDNRPDLFEISSERTAYWINAYNALSMYGHLMRDAKGPNEPETYFEVGNRSLSPADIENRRLNPQVDPRIVFALNRCTRSSPPLRSEAYAATKINLLLGDQAVRCLKDPRFVELELPVVRFNQRLLVAHQQDFTAAYQQKNGKPGTFLEAMKQLAGRDCIFNAATRFDDLQYDAALNSPPTVAAK